MTSHPSKPQAVSSTNSEPPASMRRPFRRKLRNLLIAPSYQLRTIAWIVSVALIFAGVQLAVSIAYYDELVQTLARQLSRVVGIDEQLKHDTRLLLWVALPALTTLLTASLSLLALIRTHQVAGPVYQLRQTIKRIAGGDASARAHLRRTDELQDLATEFNALMDQILPGQTGSKPRS